MTIKEIKSIFEDKNIEEWPKLISQFSSDERQGVKILMQSYEKKIDANENELLRLEKMRQFENQNQFCQYICGIDEAGRGPLAGPVVAGAVVLPKDVTILRLNDSKKLSAKVRDELYDEIKEKAIAFGVGIVSPKRIDEINILQATYEAMQYAVQDLSVVPDILLNDAVTIPKVPIPQIAIIRGDAKSVSIAAASIIAKVTRDRMMELYAQEYPEYGFDQHKGYGSAEHIRILKEIGPCPIHRTTFIKNFFKE